jgi:manganese transport protein
VLRLFGPGFMVAVGYMDPGNWATNLAGGSAWGYQLLWVILVSGFAGMFLQVLAARLGIASGLDLAQACRAHSPRGTVVPQWILCEIAICATDLAEVLGAAIALNLLFGVPLAWGVVLTVFDVMLILGLQRAGTRRLEACVAGLIAIVVLSLGYAVAAAQPDWTAVAGGLLPQPAVVTTPGMLFVAIGIIGATVMPHNLYLHSALVRPDSDAAPARRREAIDGATIDIVCALLLAVAINGSILILAAAAFHARGSGEVAELQDAHRLLATLGVGGVAGTCFALALLASAQSSSIAATLAGQVVMEGFIRIRLPPFARRLLTRGIAVMPALAVTLAYGDGGIARLLIASQVILSLQLPFAMVPLIRYTASRSIMGEHVNPPLVTAIAVAIAVTVVALNATLLWRLLG